MSVLKEDDTGTTHRLATFKTMQLSESTVRLCKEYALKGYYVIPSAVSGLHDSTDALPEVFLGYGYYMWPQFIRSFHLSRWGAGNRMSPGNVKEACSYTLNSPALNPN